MPPVGMPPPGVTPYLELLAPLAERYLPDAVAFHDEDGVDFRLQSDGYDTGLARGFKTPHRTGKLERFVPGNSSIMGRVHAQTFTAQCSDGYDIPNIFFEWAELDDLLTAVIDLFPLADLALEEDYRIRLFDPLEPTWEAFKRWAGPGYNQNMFRFVRAFASPVYIGYKLPKTPENIERCLELHRAYFEHWLRYVAEAEPVRDPERAAYYDRRKRAMIGTMLASASDVNDLIPQLIGRERARMTGPVIARGFRPPETSGLARFAEQAAPQLDGGTGPAVGRLAEVLQIGIDHAAPVIMADWNETLAVEVPGAGTLSVVFEGGTVRFEAGVSGDPAHVVRQSLANAREAITDQIRLEQLWTRLSEPFTREYVLQGNGLKLVYLYQASRQAWREDEAARVRLEALLHDD